MLDVATAASSTVHYAPPGPHAAPGRRGFACAESAPRPAPSPVEPALGRADALACSVRSALDRLAASLARAAAAFVLREGWVEFGHARLRDHARERFDRTSRWVRDLAALGRALDELPGLEEALTGSAGRPPLGRSAALLIGRVASPASLPAWIELAERSTVRQLQDAVRAARAAASSWPPGAPEAEPDRPDEDAGKAPTPAPAAAAAGSEDAPLDDPDDVRLLRFLVPEPVAAAFDETLDLFRAASGGEATVAAFVEALVGEALAGPAPPDVESVAPRSGTPLSSVEAALARATDNWARLPREADAAWGLALAGIGLASFEEVAHRAGSGAAFQLDGQIRALLELEDRLEVRLGFLLADMGDLNAWVRLGFTGADHYAEQRLGWRRSAARDRLRAARGLRRLPLLRQAYEEGTLGLAGALQIIRILGDAPADEAAQRAWLERAREATAKRLRDEARAIGRRRAGLADEVEMTAEEAGAPRETAGTGGDVAPGEVAGEGGPPAGGVRMSSASGAAPLPLDDAAWHASLRREAGTARRRVLRLGRLAASRPRPDVFLRLRLPADLAGALLAAVESARARTDALAVTVPADEPWPDPDPPGSLLAARGFLTRCRRSPAWVGLLALLEDAVDTWDASPRREADQVYERDGWRCAAPGCTSRRNLEQHHIRYRSRGGGHELCNRICLCRFHHLRGPHGGLATCRGAAPLGILWRLGRDGIGGLYRNERSLPDWPAARSG